MGVNPPVATLCSHGFQFTTRHHVLDRPNRQSQIGSRLGCAHVFCDVIQHGLSVAVTRTLLSYVIFAKKWPVPKGCQVLGQVDRKTIRALVKRGLINT
jgi:hypothetical protein